MDSAVDPEPTWAEPTEARVLDAAIAAAPALGWNSALVRRAATDAALSEADAALLLPGGPRDLAALLSRRHDRAAMAALADVDPLGLKVRERIRQGVQARVDAMAADAEAVRRCLAYLARPTGLALGLGLAWESADLIWRWAGDTATDENHYSKRAILAGVLGSVVAVRLQRGDEAARADLDAQIARVMAFEKWKAGWPKAADAMANLAAALGRVRYGAPDPVKASGAATD